jgi:glycosyltransferase involved in cell wall biosynthesis
MTQGKFNPLINSITLLHDGGPVSGISTHVYRMYLNLKLHKVPVTLYQYLRYEPEVSPPEGTIVVNRYHKRMSNHGFIRQAATAFNLYFGLNWRKFKNIDSDITILSNPSLLKLTKYMKNCGVIGHDLYYLHNNMDSKILNVYFKNQYKLFSNAKFILSVSEFTRKEFIELLDISPDIITTVYPYFDNSTFHPGESKFRQTVKIDSNDKLLLSVASDQPNKNIENVLRVLAKLPENYKLVRVGRTTSTLKLIHELNLDKRVILKKNLLENELADIYRGSDMLVFPSLFEGFGIPVVEAMASGICVLVSDRGSLPEVSGKAGVVSDPYDVNGMAENIMHILEDGNEFERRKQLGLERSRYFTMERQYETLMNVINSMITG